MTQALLKDGQLEELCHDLNSMNAWLAFDNFVEARAHGFEWADYVVLLGNQVVATLTAACELRAKLDAGLLLSGGVGHATRLLFENLRDSRYGALIRDGLITEAMGEAEMYAVVAKNAFSIPPNEMILERHSKNGGENARFSQWLLNDLGVEHEEQLILVQDPIMQRRSFLTWQREARSQDREESWTVSHAAFVPQVEPGPDGLPRLVESQRQGTWTLERYLGLVLGEMERLHDDENGYGPRGKNFIDHVDIPADVWESYRRVMASLLRELAAR